MLEKEIITKNNISIETKKATFVNNSNRWMLIISSILIALTLIISWAIWISFYEKELITLLNKVSSDLEEKGYNFKIEFYDLTLYTLLYAGIGIITVPVLAIAFRKKNFYAFLTSLVGLVYALLIFGTTFFLFYICTSTFQDYFQENELSNSLALILPWVLECLFGLVLLINSLWLLISFVFLAKQKNKLKDTFEENTMLEELKDNVSSNKIFWKTDHEHHQTEPTSTTEILTPTNTTNIIDEKAPEPPVTPPVNQTVTPPVNQTVTPPVNQTVTPPVNQTVTTSVPPTTVSPQPSVPQDINIIITNSSTPQNVPLHQTTNTEDYIIANEIMWTKEQIEATWNKALISPKLNPHLYRYDYAGALLFKNAFVNTPHQETETNVKSYNWTIVMKKPVNHGGTTNDDNLLPSHTFNALSKSNDYPKWKTNVSNNGSENCFKTKKWKE